MIWVVNVINEYSWIYLNKMVVIGWILCLIKYKNEKLWIIWTWLDIENYMHELDWFGWWLGWLRQVKYFGMICWKVCGFKVLSVRNYILLKEYTLV